MASSAARAMGKLTGRTVFITGASRGIGKAIALRCAKDGANVAIAAKTAQPHPKLPGTIYTAAKEIEDAGGQCLPCIVDVRSEQEVEKAVEDTVSRFGGIDILVNNASAIQMTGTVATSMKTYDLMNNVNTRGTYLCSKYCVPYLMKGTNPHILNISPPLNMKAHWFQGHVAYTMAKYGMSMCVLGMAEEFRDDGVAVNALWPNTAIYTAAMEMLGGGSNVKSMCRTEEIMADAAFSMLTRDSKTFTGNFAIDEHILREDGVTDFEKYALGKAEDLMPDFFLDVEPSVLKEKLGEKSAAPKGPVEINTGNATLDKSLSTIQSMLEPELVKSVGAVFQFDLTDVGHWYIDLKNASGHLGPGETAADCTMTLTSENFIKMAKGELNPTTAFMSGKLKIKGNLGIATKLEKVLKQARAKL